MHLKYISVKAGKNFVGCVTVLMEKHFSRDSETHDTGELFYFLVFAAGEDENFMVCSCYFDSSLAGNVKMLRNTRSFF